MHSKKKTLGRNKSGFSLKIAKGAKTEKIVAQADKAKSETKKEKQNTNIKKATGSVTIFNNSLFDIGVLVKKKHKKKKEEKKIRTTGPRRTPR